MIAPRSIVRHRPGLAWLGLSLLCAIGTACSHSTTFSQEKPATAERAPRNRFVNDRLFRIPKGYIGIAPLSGMGAAITRYNDSLAGAATVVLRDVTPLDFHLLSGSAGNHGLLLGAYQGRAALYTLRLGSPPEIDRSVWESTLPPLREIIGIGDFDGDGTEEAAVVGDSAFALVGLDGRERFLYQGTIVGAILRSAGDSARAIIASRAGENIYISLVDPGSGRSLATQELPGSEEIIMRLMETAGGEVLVVAALGEEPTAYLFDPATLAPPDRFPLGISPMALVAYRNGEGLTPAALFSTYPSPSILPLAGEAKRFTIDYPFTGVLEGVTEEGGYLLLLARDSIALYDRSLRLRAMLPSVGSANAEITLADTATLLISSPGGSRVISLPEEEITWLERNWLLLAVAGAGGILIGAAIAAGQRYRFVRTVYNNLVRVPSSHGVIIITSTQRIKQINQSAREMLEISPYIPLGRHVTEYIVRDEFRTVLAALRRLFAEGAEFEERIDLPLEGAGRSLTFRGRPMVGRYGYTAGYLLLVEDVTQTIERERLVNWASVAHHIAHEMKTPLSTVRMTAEMLHDRLNSNGNAGEYQRATGRIMKQSARLREIVEDLLTVARTESMQKVGTDMEVLLRSLIHDSIDSLPANVELRLEIGNGNFRSMADVGQLIVALRNLLDNAAQAIGTRAGGLIRVSLTEAERSHIITIEDNGVGMTRETLARFFQPFYTEREGGSGIGTVIIKRVIEGHGGTIRVESERGKGTVFTVMLPKG